MAESRTLAAAPELSSDPEIRPTPLAALAMADMPTALHFVRNHFGIPTADACWSVAVGGAVQRPSRLTLQDLRRLPAKTQAVTLECAGHRRREFEPDTHGVQWGFGAVAEARWTGVTLEDLLLAARPSASACEVVFEGADHGGHRSTDDEVPFARSIPLGRALAGDVLVAWAMNGRPVPPRHGAPLRVIVPGVYAVASVKWLRRILVLEEPFDGPFQAADYQMLEPSGAPIGESLYELKVNALIVTPQSGTRLRGTTITVSGVAWGGQTGVASVDVRLPGRDWRPAHVMTPNPPYGLAHWRTVIRGVEPGEHTIEIRAHDNDGFIQPQQARWNALGYANNSQHVVAVTVEAT